MLYGLEHTSVWWYLRYLLPGVQLCRTLVMSPPWCLQLSQVGWPWWGEDGEVSTSIDTLSRSEVPVLAPGHGG